MMKQFLSTLPTACAILILMCAPALGFFSYHLLVDFAVQQGVPNTEYTHAAAVLGAVWEIVLLVAVTKDLIRS